MTESLSKKRDAEYEKKRDEAAENAWSFKRGKEWDRFEYGIDGFKQGADWGYQYAVTLLEPEIESAKKHYEKLWDDAQTHMDKTTKMYADEITALRAKLDKANEVSAALYELAQKFFIAAADAQNMAICAHINSVMRKYEKPKEIE